MTTNPIATANDAFRRAGPCPGSAWVMTRGIADLGPVFGFFASREVQAFDAFTIDNDPYSEHDFGSLTIDGCKLFWKIDCYDRTDMTRGSENPADDAVTRRVLTIILAREY